jgi:DNA replicative helicase MCM subunit Mcm2 (Cdc46/Mcm family)
MRTSIPETAMDDGFLSRCCLIYQQACAKIYSIPRVAGPSEDELASKLAWIAETNTGRQVLSPGAFNLYDKWYREWREAQNQRIDNSSNASVRMGVQILQLSLILKASRYSQTNIIEEQDIQDAIRIMTETSHTHRLMYERVDSNPFFTKLASLEGFFDKHRKVTRRTVLTNTKFTSDELNILLSHLQQTGKIKIFRGDVESSFVSREGSEIYRWLGLPKTGDESAEEEA